MSSITSSSLPTLPAVAGGLMASPPAYHQPVIFDNGTLAPLLAAGEACGYAASNKNESICGYGLCCSFKSVRRPLP